METISQSDLLLLAKASKTFSDAQVAMAFVSNHVVETYKLGEKDSFNPQTGEIIRFAEEAN